MKKAKNLLSTSIIYKIILDLPSDISPIKQDESHLTIILYSIGRQVVTPDKYLNSISDDHLGMNIGFLYGSPMP
jgi:hypothetical protein